MNTVLTYVKTDEPDFVLSESEMQTEYTVVDYREQYSLYENDSGVLLDTFYTFEDVITFVQENQNA